MSNRRKPRLGYTARVSVPATLTVTAEKDPNEIEIAVRRDTVTFVRGKFFRYDWPEDEAAQPAFLCSLSNSLREARRPVITRAVALCRKTLKQVPADPLAWGLPFAEMPDTLPAALTTARERAAEDRQEPKPGARDLVVIDQSDLHLTSDRYALFALTELREGLTTTRRRAAELADAWRHMTAAGPGRPLSPLAFSGGADHGHVWFEGRSAVPARYVRIIQAHFPRATFSAVRHHNREILVAHQDGLLVACVSFYRGESPEGASRIIAAALEAEDEAA